jgi:hypothetical protein
LPHQAPDFTRIRDSDCRPAIEEGMRRQLAAVAAVMHETAAPTFENTILPLERMGRLLSRVQRVFGALTSSITNDTLLAIWRALAPRLAAQRDAISLNDTLFQRIKSLYDRRESRGLDSLQRRVVDRYDRASVRAGALLSDADQVWLRALKVLAWELRRRGLAVIVGEPTAGAVVPGSFADEGSESVLMFPSRTMPEYTALLELRPMAPDLTVAWGGPLSGARDPIREAGPDDAARRAAAAPRPARVRSGQRDRTRRPGR